MQVNGVRTLRLFCLGCSAIAVFAGGCAPSRFGRALAYYADKAAVTDAAARHTNASPYYRFSTALLSDLDDAIAETDPHTQRKMAAAVLVAANALGRTSSTNELERMRANSWRPLAALAGVEPSADALGRAFCRIARTVLADDLIDVDQLARSALQKRLGALRAGVEDLPDDRGRAERQALYSWAAVLTADGIAKEEAKLPEKVLAKSQKEFDHVVIWRPPAQKGDKLLERYAPAIGMEWPSKRRYDPALDRIGAVRLSMQHQRVNVSIDVAQPTVYAYTTTAKIKGRPFRQVNYVWWFPARPQMQTKDPVAGHVDGAMLRITVDRDGSPIFVESSLNCGCAHEIFVRDTVESAARKEFGAPVSGKRFSIERHVPRKRDVVVIGTFRADADSVRPLVLSSAGYHEVCRVDFDSSTVIHTLDVAEENSYRLLPYRALDRLPLGDGIGSMFGPDGLVHYSGRREGFLLAPSGMLSAGQPRKRGTQRVRWDEYLHDDPHLLETTLRIPPLE